MLIRFLLTLGCITLTTTLAQAQNSELALEGYTEGQFKTCISCHRSDPVKQIFLTKHADSSNPNTPAAKEQCESCHGPSAAHANFPLQVKNFRFDDNSSDSKQAQNQTCLQCHDDERRRDWHGGVHDEGELSCADCHTIHAESDPLLDNLKSAFTCIGCHEDKDVQQHITGLHLIDIGTVSCTDCHNPHAKLDTALCVDCHAQDQQTLAAQSSKAQSFHATMIEKNMSCLACHSGVAHGVSSWVEEIQRQQADQRATQ